MRFPSRVAPKCRPADRVLCGFFAIAALLAVAGVGPLAAPFKARAEQLVPAQWMPRTDSQGFMWNVSSSGTVSGTNSIFSTGFSLSVNGSSVSMRQYMMKPDRSEYVLYGTVGALQVTRRIKVDPKSATIRYVEMFHNPGAAPMTAQVRIYCRLGQGSMPAIVTSSGKPFAAVLDQKDVGLVAFAPSTTGRLSVVLYMAGKRSKVRPTIQVTSNYRFYIHYMLAVKPGQTAAILHGAAQRRLTSVSPKVAAAQFKPFEARNWTRDLPADVRKAIVNRKTSGGSLSVSADFSLESLDVTAGASDTLAVGEQTRLQGAAACSSMKIRTAYGEAELALDDVAAIVGRRRAGGRSRVFMRDGQVFSGELAVENLRFTMNTGVELTLDAERLDRLVLRAKPQDGQPAPKAFAILETVRGDRLAVARNDKLSLTLRTPWGQRSAPLDEILRLAPNEEPTGHRLALRDGTRVFAYLGNEPMRLSTITFGEQEFSPHELRSMVAISLRPDLFERDTEPNAPHARLAGDNVLIGQIDLESVNFMAEGQQIPVPPNQIRVLRNISEGDDRGLLFEAQLWDGGSISGELAQMVLPFRTGDRVARIPAADLVEVHVPTPQVPEALRKKIADYIANLGNPDYKTRENASKTLAELGYLAKSQLVESLAQTSDPEVRRRIEKLLEEVKE